MIAIEPEDIAGFGELREEERFTTLRLCDAAASRGVTIRRVRRGDDPPDLLLDLDGEGVGVELKRLRAPEISAKNAWLARVHLLLEQEQLPAEVGYAPVGDARVAMPSLALAIAEAAKAIRISPECAEGSLVVQVEGRPLLELWWSKEAGRRWCVLRNGVRGILHGLDSAGLWEFLRRQVDAAEGGYPESGKNRWVLVLHDEGDLLTEPFFTAQFAAHLAAVSPLPSRVFSRVLLLGSYDRANRRYPLIDLPVASTSSSSGVNP